ncbi:hypothetical protein C8J56DRAFT_892018 [Mycena floridula]|nr:hypothetical protein C8J56DRAFT_892018 [Mycena floridula]
MSRRFVLVAFENETIGSGQGARQTGCHTTMYAIHISAIIMPWTKNRVTLPFPVAIECPDPALALVVHQSLQPLAQEWRHCPRMQVFLPMLETDEAFGDACRQMDIVRSRFYVVQRDAMICIFTNGDLPTSAMPNVSSMEEAETLFAKLYPGVPSIPMNHPALSQPSGLPAASMPLSQSPLMPTDSVTAPPPRITAPSTPKQEGKPRLRDFPISTRISNRFPNEQRGHQQLYLFGQLEMGIASYTFSTENRLSAGAIPLAGSPSSSQSPFDSLTLEQDYGLDIGTLLRRYLDVHHWSRQGRQTLLTMLQAYDE